MVERLGLLVCGLCLGTVTLAADETAEQPDPDAEFLEYLGMWEDTDEEWLLHDGILTVEREDESESSQEGDDSAENEDES
ncbi:MAG: hypothetical protein P8Y01_09700 [Woeseiaceae bacterium]